MQTAYALIFGGSILIMPSLNIVAMALFYPEDAEYARVTRAAKGGDDGR